MPLVDLKTDLKSLKYGKDRPGGGSSKQPFIQTKAKNSFDLPIEKLGNEVAGVPAGPDFILRGGLLAPVRAATDASRLFQLFTQTPSGLQFTAKQNILSRTSVETESSTGPGYGFNAVNQGIYTPLSTLSQAAVGFSGTHLNLLGLDPTGLTPLGLIKYETAANLRNSEIGNFEFNGKFYATNRLLKLTDKKINTETLDPNILSYSGGPGSVLGIGKTNIEFADQRTGINNPLAKLKPKYFYTGSGESILTDTSDLDGKRYFQTIEAPLIVSSNRFDTFTVAKIGDTLLSPFTINNKLIDDVVPNTGSYQNGLKNSSTNRVGLYNGSLDYARLTRTGLSQTYINLTSGSYKNVGEIINNNFSQADSLNVYTQGNTFPKVSQLQRANNTFTYTQEELINTTPSSKGGSVQDFRKIIKENSKNDPKFNKAKKNGTLSSAPSYRDKNIEQRVGLGDPGSIGGENDRSDYEKGNPNSKGGLDKINSLYLYRSENVTKDPIKNDLCKFRIAVIDADPTKEPIKKTFIHFRAFINSFSDNMSAAWNSFKYPGRGEDFYTYQGFTNNVNIDFTVAVQSVQELSPVYKKLNYLKSSLTPNYGTNGYMKGNIHQLTLGGYFYEVPGIIDSVNYTIPNESPWEIAIPSDNTEREAEGGITFRNPEVKELPLIVDVSISFKPIYDFLPQIVQNIDSGTKEKFISLASNNNTSLYDT